MIWALEACLLTASTCKEGGMMATHIVKSVKFPICITAYDEFYISKSVGSPR
jgi:hypothetical protein